MLRRSSQRCAFNHRLKHAPPRAGAEGQGRGQDPVWGGSGKASQRKPYLGETQTDKSMPAGQRVGKAEGTARAKA